MRQLHRFLCLLLVLCLFLLPVFPAAATDKDLPARSFEMYPDSGRKTTAEDLNAFLAGLSTESVESLQVVYETPWEEENPGLEFAPTPIGPAEYPQLIALLKDLRLFVSEKWDPLTGGGTAYYLAVTTKEATVKLSLWDSSNKTAWGTLGWVSLLEIGSVSQPFSKTKENRIYRKLGEKISALPEVQKARDEIKKQEDAQQLQHWKEQGLQMLNGPAVSLDPNNPPALAVAAADVAEFNLFQDGYWARVTKPDDQRKLLNLINGTQAISWNSLANTGYSVNGGRVLLQLRLTSGEKHEYKTSKDGTALIADGKYSYDPSAILVFDEALGEMLSGYPVGIAWLGTMNPHNVTEMTVDNKILHHTLSLDSGPEELEKAVRRLRGLILHGGSSQKFSRGSLPEEITGKTADCRIGLKFLNGVTYQMNFYEGKMVDISSSDMGFSYFYQAGRIEDTVV